MDILGGLVLVLIAAGSGYGEYNHGIDEAVRRLHCAINDKKFKKKRYKSTSSSVGEDMA